MFIESFFFVKINIFIFIFYILFLKKVQKKFVKNIKLEKNHKIFMSGSVIVLNIYMIILIK